MQYLLSFLTLAIVFIYFLVEYPNSVEAQPAAERLIAELGCTACHSTLKISPGMRQKTPDLGFAGLRYNPAYLFEYLQQPTRIRRHIGDARMPSFYLSEKEALALTLFLQTQTTIAGGELVFPVELTKARETGSAVISEQEFKTFIADTLICFSCHTYRGKGGSLGPELSTASVRLNTEWVRKYLAAPHVYGVPPAVMPAQFYRQSASGNQLSELMPGAADKINRLAGYLFSLNLDKVNELEKSFREVREANPGITAETGERIFQALNCAGCHQKGSVESRNAEVAPDLTLEGLRVKREWLKGYLASPKPLRPFGYLPGSGSRMPDFTLSEAETDVITEFLMSQKHILSAAPEEFNPRVLSAFSRRKAKLLLQKKLSCLGCHRLNGIGGRIGPDLSNISERLQPSYLYSAVANPRKILPGSIMPKIPLTAETQDLIVNFLLQEHNPPQETGYLSLVDTTPLANNSSSEIGGRYLAYCAPCHGEKGKADGFNRPFLPVRPTNHADAAYMSRRPDDTLFDGTFSGGYILNKHHFMPPWGETLSYKEIEELVKYMRDLCNCEGPAWSRDNQKIKGKR